MSQTLPSIEDILAIREYPGRFIVLGNTPSNQQVVIYGITGRSPSSQARRLFVKNGAIHTEPTDPTALAKGNPSLLLYKAVARTHDVQVASNGEQTNVILREILDFESSEEEYTPLELLVRSFAFHEPSPQDPNINLSSHEPDDPNYTPRISGVLRGPEGAFAILKKGDFGGEEKHYFEFSLAPGSGRFISTYTGQNVRGGEKLPSFRGEPLYIDLSHAPEDAQTLANQVYAAMGPKEPREGFLSPEADMRVGVSVMIYTQITGKQEIEIRNRHE